MLIRTCFFFACLPVASHVWGRGGQGKDLTCTALGGLWAGTGAELPTLLVGKLQAAYCRM